MKLGPVKRQNADPCVYWDGKQFLHGFCSFEQQGATLFLLRKLFYVALHSQVLQKSMETDCL